MTGLFTISALAAAGLAAVVADPELYERSLERAVERAQRRLVERTDLYRDHSSWEDPWAVRSGSYEVRTTESRRYGLDVAEGLEGMLANYRALLGTDFAPSEPFAVYVLPGLTEYNRFGDEHGAEHSSILGSFFADQHSDRPVATMHTENWTQQMMWLTHGAVHQYLDRAYARSLPLWLEEGLASYFALFWDFEWAKAELDRIEAGEGRWVPLASLIGAGIGDYTDRPNERLHELGMLFAYLLAFREDTRTVYDADGEEVRAPFADYVRGVLAGTVDPTAGALDFFEGATLQDIERDFRACTF